MTTQMLEKPNGRNTRVKVHHEFMYRGASYSVVSSKKNPDLVVVETARLYQPELRKNDFWIDSHGGEYQVLEFTQRYVIFMRKGEDGTYPHTVKREDFIAQYKPAF